MSDTSNSEQPLEHSVEDPRKIDSDEASVTSEDEAPGTSDEADGGAGPAASDPPSTGKVRQRALQEELKQLVDVVGPGPLVDLLLERAFQLQATDIHLDPTGDGLRVRLRVDGLLHDVLKLPQAMTSHVVSRIKLLAGMNITERRIAQDGRISNEVLKHLRDIRVGSGPTVYGERLVLRLMPDGESLTRLEELGMLPVQIDAVKKFLEVPYGMVVSVGPVGSGKSTTVYGCVTLLNHPAKSLVTIEDPVERRIEGVNQTQVDPKADFHFIDALRGVLRQDPDVMMVGEIRDPETAHISVRAGLTGVVVLTTMHANDAPSAVDVFREFGVPSMFIADSLEGIISQRLVRKLCLYCREPYRPSDAQWDALGVTPEMSESMELYRARGCDNCFNTGFSGRTGIFEVLPVSGRAREAIVREEARDVIARIAESEGMITLEQSARQRVIDGTTSAEEMHRVLTAFPVK